MKPPGICNMDSPSPEWVVMRDEALLSLMLALFTFTALSLGCGHRVVALRCRQRGPVHACMQPYHLLSEQNFKGERGSWENNPLINQDGPRRECKVYGTKVRSSLSLPFPAILIPPFPLALAVSRSVVLSSSPETRLRISCTDPNGSR